MEKEWFTYKIFVSSTFRDMDQERDMIKFQVLSRLNEHFRSLKIQFQMIDLRIGINTEKLTEEQSEFLVLDSCLQNIDNARPFFIGLLGERYGWIPSPQRWETVLNRLDKERRLLLTGGEKRSVTELEILYGAIGNNGQYINHSLFFFRDKDSYENVPNDLLPIYIDQNADNRNKSKKLKERIIEVAKRCQMSDICEEYHLTWNCHKRVFEGLDAFADLLYNRLCLEINKEIKERKPPQSWIDQECLNRDFLHMKNVQLKIQTNQYSDIYKRIREGGQVIMTGKQGIGKSVILSQVYRECSKVDYLTCLSSFVGMSPYSRTMHSIVRGWIVEMGGPEKDEREDEKELKTVFVSCFNKMRQSGKTIIFFLDGVENFIPLSPKDIFLSWLPEDAPFLVTVAEPFVQQVRKYHPKASLINILPFTNGEENEAIKKLEIYYNISLPERLRTWFRHNNPLPICINLLIIIISNFSTKDFRIIRSKNADSEIEKINLFITDILYQAPLNDVGQMLKFAVRKVAENLGLLDMLLLSIKYIACSGGGLTEQDLENLIDKIWDPLRFHSLMSVFNEFFYCEPDFGRWHFRNPNYGKAFFVENTEESKKMSSSIAQLLLTYDDEEKQKQELLFYHLLKSGQSELSRGLMTNIETESRMKRGGWYRISMQYILSEDSPAELINNICHDYSASDRVGFIYYFKSFLPPFSHSDVMVKIVDNNLKDVDYRDLSTTQAYQLANLYGGLFQLSKYTELLNFDVSEDSYVYYLERSIEGYIYCYSLQSDYKDTKNMLCCMMSEMLPIFAMKNDFASLENYMSIINNLNHI